MSPSITIRARALPARVAPLQSSAARTGGSVATRSPTAGDQRDLEPAPHIPLALSGFARQTSARLRGRGRRLRVWAAVTGSGRGNDRAGVGIARGPAAVLARTRRRPGGSRSVGGGGLRDRLASARVLAGLGPARVLPRLESRAMCALGWRETAATSSSILLFVDPVADPVADRGGFARSPRTRRSISRWRSSR